MAYRIYVTDSLRALLGNDQNGRFIDFVREADNPKQEPEEEQSADEIIERIRGKLRMINGSNSI